MIIAKFDNSDTYNSMTQIVLSIRITFFISSRKKMKIQKGGVH